ncbi:unnamed protein product [Cylindrotheca closterium]|uniref:Uncharacterized protein n=1 Tax=Cylindrotheca closterium TaxID=2856 RepID=A0AAD2JM48_9STRA|nr:unnamed protein product [Cylindrotheca closterium]
MDEEDTKRQQQDDNIGDDVDSKHHSTNVVDLKHDNGDHHVLLSYTYFEENLDQPVPPNVQRLVVIPPTNGIPRKLCYFHERLRQVTLSSGLQTIGVRAFFGCVSLEEVNLPFSIKAIYESAFEECSSLVSVNQQLESDSEMKEADDMQKPKDQHSQSIGNLILSKYKTWMKMNGSIGTGTVIEYRAFKGCTSLRNIIAISSTMRSIKERAFEDCRGLLDLNFSASGTLIQIQSCAFKNCKSVQSIQIPSTVDVLGSYSFLRCNSLVDVTLAEGLKTVGNFAFTYCSSLEEIKVPWTVKSIEKGAFSFCEALITVDLQGDQAEIHPKVFQECSSLQRMALPLTNKMLHSDALSNCRCMVQVILPDSLVAIGHSALRDCKSLRSLALPKTLKRIHAYAISGCSNLVSVEIPKGTKAKLGPRCFQGCEVLTNIAIPPSMGKLVIADPEANLFSGCMLLSLQTGGGPISQYLEHRFEMYPVHELCYYASSTTRAHLEEQIQKSFPFSKDVKHNEMKNMQDVMGMTPFHMLLSASTRRLDLLEVLLNAYPATMLLVRNESKMLALEYLISNWTLDARLMMRKCLQKCILDPLQNWGLDAWRVRMMDVVDSACCAGDTNSRDIASFESHLEARLNGALDGLATCKELEVTSLLEQWLWKMALLCTPNNRESEVERSICRAKCGASFIIPIVKTFLNEETWGTGF